MNRGESTETEPLIVGGTKKSTRRRNALAAALVCCVLLIIVVVAGAIGATVILLRQPANADLAEAVRKNMDESASPCDDFFQYSCGGWLTDNPLGLADRNDRFVQVGLKNLKSLSSLIEGNVDSSVPAVQLARKFYYSCKDTDAINVRGVQPLLDLVRLTGGWDAISVSNCESCL